MLGRICTDTCKIYSLFTDMTGFDILSPRVFKKVTSTRCLPVGLALYMYSLDNIWHIVTQNCYAYQTNPFKITYVPQYMMAGQPQRKLEHFGPLCKFLVKGLLSKFLEMFNMDNVKISKVDCSIWLFMILDMLCPVSEF